MDYADGTPTSWTSFGSTGVVSNTGPSSGIGYGIGPGSITKPYHDYIRFVITGNATIMNYTGTRQFWWLPSVASIAFPLTVNQGGTGLNFAPFITDALYASFPLGCTAAHSAGVTLIVTQAWDNVVDGTTCAAAIKVYGTTALIQAAASATVTLSGSIDAPYNIQFLDATTNSSASIVISKPQKISPQWFGDFPDGTDHAVNGQAALASLTNGGELYFPCGASAYVYSAGLNVTVAHVKLSGAPCANLQIASGGWSQNFSASPWASLITFSALYDELDGLTLTGCSALTIAGCEGSPATETPPFLLYLSDPGQTGNSSYAYIHGTNFNNNQYTEAIWAGENTTPVGVLIQNIHCSYIGYVTGQGCVQAGLTGSTISDSTADTVGSGFGGGPDTTVSNNVVTDVETGNSAYNCGDQVVPDGCQFVNNYAYVAGSRSQCYGLTASANQTQPIKVQGGNCVLDGTSGAPTGVQIGLATKVDVTGVSFTIINQGSVISTTGTTYTNGQTIHTNGNAVMVMGTEQGSSIRAFDSEPASGRTTTWFINGDSMNGITTAKSNYLVYSGGSGTTNMLISSLCTNSNGFLLVGAYEYDAASGGSQPGAGGCVNMTSNPASGFSSFSSAMRFGMVNYAEPIGYISLSQNSNGVIDISAAQGTLTNRQTEVRLECYSGNSCNLVKISNGQSGDRVEIRINSASHIVTVSNHGTGGNIELAGSDWVPVNTTDRLALSYDVTNSEWVELYRALNHAP